ncbi:MAG: zf-HC2 domain-containing protein [Candidatus Binatia bacterium]
MTTRKKALTTSIDRTCKEITGLILDYLNDTLSPSVRRDFNRHLRICPDCVAFLRTYKKTASLTRSVRVEDLPDKVRRNILDYLRQGTKKTDVSS